jgi:hypothetical protein
MNYTRKTLDDLAGGDDKIFVVIDDRDDVWSQQDGTCIGNLLKIPAYFYTRDKQNHFYRNATYFEK